MKTILVTCFEPFDSEFLRYRSIGGFGIIVASLSRAIPHYNRGKKILESACHIKASGILSLDVGSEKSVPYVEEVAGNRLNGEGLRVDESYPYGHEIAINLLPWKINAISSCPNFWARSQDAGNSYANHLMFQVRASQLGGFLPDLPFLFVHLPYTTLATAEKEVTELIEMVLGLAEL